jgi:hypothetical protein
MEKQDAPHSEEVPPIQRPASLEEKLRLIRAMRGCAAGGPSMCDELLEDRRRERERELAEDGW